MPSRRINEFQGYFRMSKPESLEMPHGDMTPFGLCERASQYERMVSTRATSEQYENAAHSIRPCCLAGRRSVLL